VAIMAVEEQLAEIGRRINQLDARAEAGAAEAKSQIQRHLDTLRHGLSEYAVAVEDKLRQLEIKLDIAEHRLASQFAGDPRTFVDAVQAELHDWDTYLERLQMKAATKAQAGSERAQAEAMVRELRRCRNTVAKCLAEVRAASSGAWRERTQRVTTAREELERKIDEVSAKFD
jgi:uncharacterized protein YfaS (alpha-2-macroglobulin family)